MAEPQGMRQRATELFGAALSGFVARAAKVPAVVGGAIRSFTMRQPLIQASSSWTIENVREAITLHERGDFSKSAMLVEAFGRDDRITSCLNTRLYALASSNGVDFSIEPPEGGSDELAKEAATWWYDAMPDELLRQLHGDVVMIGAAFARITWRTTASKWIVDRVERWHPANIRWDDHERCFMARTELGEEIIDPDDPCWFFITPGGERSWLAGGVRALGFCFVARSWNWRDWARFNERHGMPMVALSEPMVTNAESAKAFYESVKKMGSGGIVRLPRSADGVAGYDLNLKEATSTGWATFQQFRSDLDVSIAVFLLGQNLTTESKGGSYALGKVQDRVRGDYLGNDAESMGTPLRKQLLAPYFRFNAPASMRSKRRGPRGTRSRPRTSASSPRRSRSSARPSKRSATRVCPWTRSSRRSASASR